MIVRCSLALIASALLALQSTAAAQLFGPELLLNSALDYQEDVDFADVDGDGDADLLTTRSIGAQTSWIENLGGGAYGALRSIGFDAVGGGSRSVRGADLDGDGDVDVVTTRFSVFTGDPVGWYENLGGGVFGGYQLLSTTGSGTHGRALDMDADGDVDVVFLADGIRPTWCENLGGGNFVAPAQIATWNTEATALEVADMDGDSLPDIVWSVGLSSRIFWVQNLGGGSFSTRLLLSDQVVNPRDLQLGDVDGDGDRDVVTPSLTNATLHWIENLGGGAFNAPQTLPGSMPLVRKIGLGDVDADGDVDVLSGAGSLGFGWHENLGAGAFAPVVTLSNPPTFFARVLAHDVDADGDLDPVTASNRVTWLANEGAGAFGAPLELTIRVQGRPADFDGDDVADLVGIDALSGTVEWSRNLGSAAFTGSESLLTGLNEPTDVAVLDVDADGDRDLLVGSGSFNSAFAGVNLYVNQGGFFAPPQNLYGDISDSGAFLVLGELDGDGDLDVLVNYVPFVSPNQRALAWLRNDGGGVLTPLPVQVIGSIGAFDFGDMDEDGDLDLVVTRSALQSEEFAWYRNQGGTFDFVAALGSFGPSGVRAYALGDVDGDGDNDVLFGHEFTDELQVIENLGGGIFAAAQVIAAGPADVVHVEAIDVDQDGDDDPLVFAVGQAQWLESLGGGAYGAATPFPDRTGHWATSAAYGVDLDGDTDLDLLKQTTFGPAVQLSELRFGTGYCGPAVPNSSGASARISAAGSAVAAHNNVTLIADRMPAGQFGYFLVADGAGFVALPGGAQGDLCVGGAIGRLNAPGQLFTTSGAGDAQVVLDLTSVPTPNAPESLVTGDTRYLQAWFRDVNPGATSNFTNGLAVTFE